ncbi:MAG: BrnT family toxin [Pseudomonadota bacterium]
MSHTFDPKKNAANIRKHGVSLSEGDGVFSDPLALTNEDDAVESEQRSVAIGLNTFGALMVVVFAYRDDDVRLISVRNATPKERRVYEKGI